MALPSILFGIFALLAAAGVYWMTMVTLEDPGRRRWAPTLAVGTLLFFAALYGALALWIWPLLTES